MISAAVLLAQRILVAPAAAFIGARARPPPASVASSLAPFLRASSTDSTAAVGVEPTIDQTLSAAKYVKTQLEAIVNSGRRDMQSISQQEVLLNDLHSIASTLLEYDAADEAAVLFQYSLDEFDSSNVVVRERLSASLRAMGSTEESARELYRVIHALEDEIGSQDQMGMVGADGGESLSWLYLDLGGLIEEIRPLPGAGPSWDAVVHTDGPKVSLEFDSAVEDSFTISLDDDDDDDEDILGDNINAKGTQGEDLSAVECYQRAISYNAQNGSAHKRLADALAILGRNVDALKEFEVASFLLPQDICCATHTFYGKNLGVQREKGPLAMAAGPASKSLIDLEWDIDGLIENNDEETMLSKMAAAFERDGVLVFPGLVSSVNCNHVLKLVDQIILKARSGEDTDETSFTDETRSAANRLHLALPLKNHGDTLSDLFGRLYPLLARILDCSGDKIPLLGSGFMRTSPGAKGQDLHKDVHHYDRHLPVDKMPKGASINQGEPRCVSIQLQLTDTSLGDGAMGSLGILPGSHRPDAPNGEPRIIKGAVKDPKLSNGVISVEVPAGTVTIYSSRLWHRGGPNDSADGERTFAFFTVTEPNCLAPPGLIHTMDRDDVGEWMVTEEGLLRVQEDSFSG